MIATPMAMKPVRSGFRPYAHDPGRIEAAGFGKQYEDHDLVWLTQVYVAVQ